MVSTDIRDSFIEKCVTGFDFLTKKYQFSVPEIVRDESIVIVRYRKGDIAIEFCLDIREHKCDAYVVRLINGEPKRFPMVEKNGVINRIGLVTLISKQKRPTKKYFEQADLTSLAELEAYKELLVHEGEEILEDSGFQV